MYLYGMKVVSTPLAREVRDEWRVERHPLPKRRRQWRVVKHHIDKPGCYRVGDTFYMHPDIVAQLPQLGKTPDLTFDRRRA